MDVSSSSKPGFASRFAEVTVTVALVDRPAEVVPRNTYVPGPDTHSVPGVHVTACSSVLRSLYETVTVVGSVISSPSATVTAGEATAVTSRGATAPVRAYENTFRDSSGVPSWANRAWLSQAEPP
jgi:hypothetical protein